VPDVEHRGNRLAGAQSPYLAQHASNPVDWWPWGQEAFAEAARRDVPVLLSVGYAACHWCHVMAHESFEDAAVAAVMNEHFVNVKVDREERPDVDATYMAATQALTGQGGWPMTVFLTPAGRPFYAGTYFPPQPAGRLPSFRQVLQAVQETWVGRRQDVEQAGQRIAQALAGRSLPKGAGRPDADLLDRAAAALLASEDHRYGGFGPAPKFPPAMDLEFLLRHVVRRRAEATSVRSASASMLVVEDDPASAALAAASRTLRAMAHSGMQDQLAGGFARYAVDQAWVVPHFEKMLYDNALLARVYLHWWRLTGEPTGARIAVGTCDWMLAALRTPHGGLASSLDADTPLVAADGTRHGVEGYTYVWTQAQLRQVLGEEDAAWAAELLAVTEHGTFERGASTLQLTRDVWAGPEAQRWRAVRNRLLARRLGRPQPERDDKVVAAWNGLAIAALAETGALLDRPDLVTAAEEIAHLLLGTHLVSDDAGAVRRLRRVSRDGVAGEAPGVLEDYGDLAEGLLALYAVSGRADRFTAAGELLDVALDQFADPEGGFFDTAADATDAAITAIRRPQEPTDNAYPSGTSALAGALLSYAALSGSARHREAAERALATVTALGPAAPRAFGWGLAAAEAALDGPREVAIVGRPEDPARAVLHRTALAGTAPGLVVAVGEPDLTPEVPVLAERPGIGGAATAYVCRGFVCEAPTTDPAVLAAQVAARAG